MSGVLVVGTDGEENLWKAMSNIFSSAVHLVATCTLRTIFNASCLSLKSTLPAREITHDIFGCTLDDSSEGMYACKI